MAKGRGAIATDITQGRVVGLLGHATAMLLLLLEEEVELEVETGVNAFTTTPLVLPGVAAGSSTMGAPKRRVELARTPACKNDTHSHTTVDPGSKGLEGAY